MADDIKMRKLLDMIMKITGGELKDRLRECCLRTVERIDDNSPNLFIALEVAQLFWAASALLGGSLWEQIGRNIHPYARNRMGRCGHSLCANDIAVEDTHSHVCQECEEREVREAAELARQAELEGDQPG